MGTLFPVLFIALCRSIFLQGYHFFSAWQTLAFLVVQNMGDGFFWLLYVWGKKMSFFWSYLFEFIYLFSWARQAWCQVWVFWCLPPHRSLAALNFWVASYGISFPWPGIEPGLPALKVQCLSCWTTRDAVCLSYLNTYFYWAWILSWLFFSVLKYYSTIFLRNLLPSLIYFFQHNVSFVRPFVCSQFLLILGASLECTLV